MSTLTIPSIDPDEESKWPSLGPQVAAWIEANLVFGPGDLRADPAVLDDETYLLLYRMYQVYPHGHEKAGRRRFKRVAISLRKGTAKTEKAAWIAAAELHPDAPVRCDGFRKEGSAWVPVGRGVKDPYIPMVAYTEEQTDELAYGALYAILSEGPLADDFDIGLQRIMRKDGTGRAVALASAPDSRDGARTTFQHFDETHRFTLPRLREAHRTMLANIPKRPLADPWSLETTTAYTPGEGSVAESTFEYAKSVERGQVRDSQLFFFHRQASDEHDLSTYEGVKAAVIEASGPYAAWSDIDSIVAPFFEPDTDRPYLERVWTNRPMQDTRRAFDVNRWRQLAKEKIVAPGVTLTLGFDGSRTDDATALVATDVESGYQWPLGIWERRPGEEGWEVPVEDVERELTIAFDTWKVWKLYADPFKWDEHLSKWAARWGRDRVLLFETNQYKRMSQALKSYHNAMLMGEVSHSGDDDFTRHIGNAVRRKLNIVDDDGEPLWLIEKDRRGSPNKIDAAMAGCLSWQARVHALAHEKRPSKPRRMVSY